MSNQSQTERKFCGSETINNNNNKNDGELLGFSVDGKVLLLIFVVVVVLTLWH